MGFVPVLKECQFILSKLFYESVFVPSTKYGNYGQIFQTPLTRYLTVYFAYHTISNKYTFF